jgi:hypothetical protein
MDGCTFSSTPTVKIRFQSFLLPRSFIMLSSAALIVTASMAWGQVEQESPVREELLVFRPYIGTWVGEITVPEDVPGIARQGDQVPVSLTFSWAKNGQAVIGNLSMNLTGRLMDFGQSMYAWDPQQKKIVGLDTNTLGELSRYEITTKNGNLIFTSQGTAADGTKISSVITYQWVDDDSLQAQLTQRREGEKTLPDTIPAIVTRSTK